MTLEFTDTNFEELAIKADKPVLVDFWAEWCEPCRKVGPIVEEIGAMYEGKAVVGKVNVDKNPAISARYGMRNIPTMVILSGGEEVDRAVGVVPKSTLTNKIDAHL